MFLYGPIFLAQSNIFLEYVTRILFDTFLICHSPIEILHFPIKLEAISTTSRAAVTQSPTDQPKDMMYAGKKMLALQSPPKNEK
jgi:hypothetical protein